MPKKNSGSRLPCYTSASTSTAWTYSGCLSTYIYPGALHLYSSDNLHPASCSHDTYLLEERAPPWQLPLTLTCCKQLNTGLFAFPMEKILSVCFSFFCHIVLSLLSKMTFISSLVAQRQLLIFPRSLSTFNSPFCYLANSYIYVINLNYFQLHYILSSPSISSLSSTRSPSLVPPSLNPPPI